MTNNKETKKMEELNYEEAVQRLEKIVERLENAEIPLEESLSAFQEGIKLSRYCREKLAEIEYKVDYLLKEEQQQEPDPQSLQDEQSQPGGEDK